VNESPPDLAALAPDAPRAMVDACMGALAKDPAERPPSAAAFAAMLAGTPTVPYGGPVGAVPEVEKTRVLPAPAAQAGAAPTAVVPPVAAGAPAARVRRPRPPALARLLPGALGVLLAGGGAVAPAVRPGPPS